MLIPEELCNFIIDSFCFWKTWAIKVFVLHFVKTLIFFHLYDDDESVQVARWPMCLLF